MRHKYPSTYTSPQHPIFSSNSLSIFFPFFALKTPPSYNFLFLTLILPSFPPISLLLSYFSFSYSFFFFLFLQPFKLFSLINPYSSILSCIFSSCQSISLSLPFYLLAFVFLLSLLSLTADPLLDPPMFVYSTSSANLSIIKPKLKRPHI